MTKEAKQIAIIVAGLCVIAVVLPMSLKKIKQAQPGSPAPSQDTSTKLVESMTAQAKREGGLNIISFSKMTPIADKDALLKQEETRKLPWKRDPFKKSPKVVAQPDEAQSYMRNYVVTGIVVKDGVGMAVINNEIVGVGDELEGYKIKAINDDSVVVEKEGKELILKLDYDSN